MYENFSLWGIPWCICGHIRIRTPEHHSQPVLFVMLYQAVLNLVLSKKPRSGNHANESYLNNLIFLSFIEVPFSQPFETSLRFELKSVGITRGVKFLQMGASIRSFFHATFSLFVTPDATVKTHVDEPYFFQVNLHRFLYHCCLL